jgi:hypothetical protein
LPDQETRRDRILKAAGNVAMAFLYYDRKEDGYLPAGEIEDAIFRREITADEIMTRVLAGFTVLDDLLRVPSAGTGPLGAYLPLSAVA